ncbi:hypothetical protein HZB88_05050 [archaeon]|nr:hypothetical protein [archaeon]
MANKKKVTNHSEEELNILRQQTSILAEQRKTNRILALTGIIVAMATLTDFYNKTSQLYESINNLNIVIISFICLTILFLFLVSLMWLEVATLYSPIVSNYVDFLLKKIRIKK